MGLESVGPKSIAGFKDFRKVCRVVGVVSVSVNVQKDLWSILNTLVLRKAEQRCTQ